MKSNSISFENPTLVSNVKDFTFDFWVSDCPSQSRSMNFTSNHYIQKNVEYEQPCGSIDGLSICTCICCSELLVLQDLETKKGNPSFCRCKCNRCRTSKSRFNKKQKMLSTNIHAPDTVLTTVQVPTNLFPAAAAEPTFSLGFSNMLFDFSVHPQSHPEEEKHKVVKARKRPKSAVKPLAPSLAQNDECLFDWKVGDFSDETDVQFFQPEKSVKGSINVQGL